jgi:ABC-type glycerol-3-phosphate transport system substrate-binding protein
MNNNRYLTLALIILFGFAILSFGYIAITKYIYPSNPALGPKTTIEYWGLFESEIVMNELIKKYEAENPSVKINYTQKLAENDLDNYKETLYSRLENGTGPTIFRAHSTWMPKFYNELSRNKSLPVEQFQNRFYKVADYQCVTVTNEMLCIPIMYDGLVLLYNEDLLRNAGISPQSIRSWEDLRIAAKKLTITQDAPLEYDQIKVTRGGLALGSTNNVSGSTDIIGLMFAQNKIKIPDDLDTEKVGLVFEFYNNFVKQDQTWDEEMPNSLNAFASGQAAMVFAKSEQIIRILQLNPTINLGALPVPQLPLLDGTLTNDGWASFWVEGVSADATNSQQTESWKFLEWLSREENQVYRFNVASDYKRFGEPYSDKSLRDNLIKSPLLGPIVQTAPNAVTGIIADEVGNSPYGDVIKAAISDYAKTISVEDKREVLTKLKADYEALLQNQP